MSLLSEALLAGPEPYDRAPGSCRLKKVLQQFSGTDAELLAKAAEKNSSWSSTRLAKLLKDLNYQISDNSINRHRNGECSCGRL